MDPLRNRTARGPAHPETGPGAGGRPAPVALLLLALLLVFTPDTRTQAMMMVSRSGRMITGPGGEYGFERVSTFWSGLGETRSWRLAAGPVAVSGYEGDSSTSGAVLPGPTRRTVALSLFGWHHSFDPAGSGVRWVGVFLLVAIAAGVGGWRKHVRNRGPIPRPVAV